MAVEGLQGWVGSPLVVGQGIVVVAVVAVEPKEAVAEGHLHHQEVQQIDQED